MSDKQAQAEAWVRKKKRIIYNENVIKLLIILAAAIPIPLCTFLLWIVFIFPFMPFIVLVVWSIAASIYVTLNIVVAKRKRSSAA